MAGVIGVLQRELFINTLENAPRPKPLIFHRPGAGSVFIFLLVTL